MYRQPCLEAVVELGGDEDGGMPKSVLYKASYEGNSLKIVKQSSVESTNMINKIIVSKMNAR